MVPAHRVLLYPRNYRLEALLNKRPELAEIAVTAYLRGVVMESA